MSAMPRIKPDLGYELHRLRSCRWLVPCLLCLARAAGGLSLVAGHAKPDFARDLHGLRRCRWPVLSFLSGSLGLCMV